MRRNTKPIVLWLWRRAENMAVILLAVMFFGFVLQVVSRYVFNHPVGWTLELSLTTWLWLVFWASAMVLRTEEHVSFSLVYDMSSPRVRRVMRIIGSLVVAVGLLAALPAVWDYVMFLKIKKSATLGIRLNWVFSIYILFTLVVSLRLLLGVGHDIRSWNNPSSENDY